MNQLHEIFPIVAGIAYGMTFHWQSKTLKTTAVLVMAAILTALAASAISGELAQSWWYVAVDLAEIVTAAVVTVAVASVLNRASWVNLR
jgi:hypothetical protein